MAKSDGCDYFRRTSLFWIFTVTFSMGYFTWVVFWPHQVPYDYLGPVGTLSKYLVDNHYSLMYKGVPQMFHRFVVALNILADVQLVIKNLMNESGVAVQGYGKLRRGWWAAWIIHLAEALFAMKVCSDKGVDGTMVRCLWFFQTVLYGFASLGLLLKYKRDHRHKQQ